MNFSLSLSLFVLSVFSLFHLLTFLDGVDMAISLRLFDSSVFDPPSNLKQRSGVTIIPGVTTSRPCTCFDARLPLLSLSLSLSPLLSPSLLSVLFGV